MFKSLKYTIAIPLFVGVMALTNLNSSAHAGTCVATGEFQSMPVCSIVVKIDGNVVYQETNDLGQNDCYQRTLRKVNKAVIRFACTDGGTTGL